MFPSDRLNDLLIDLGRSLLQYVGESWPWASEEEAAEQTAVERMVAEQRETVLQFAALLDERGHRIAYGQYPSEYTSLHYVALDYLLDQLLDDQQYLADELTAAALESGDDEAARHVISAAADQAAGHHRELQELIAKRKFRSGVTA
ncbi:MAG: hypothetical protein U0992_20005 [Planctomycetaceae bacterium]